MNCINPRHGMGILWFTEGRVSSLKCEAQDRQALAEASHSAEDRLCETKPMYESGSSYLVEMLVQNKANLRGRAGDNASGGIQADNALRRHYKREPDVPNKANLPAGWACGGHSAAHENRAKQSQLRGASSVKREVPGASDSAKRSQSAEAGVSDKRLSGKELWRLGPPGGREKRSQSRGVSSLKCEVPPILRNEANCPGIGLGGRQAP